MKEIVCVCNIPDLTSIFYFMAVISVCLLLFQVEFLCERGADVNRGQRSSSLHYAACFGRPQVAKVTHTHWKERDSS